MLYIWCLKYLLNIWCKISAYWPPCALSVWADVSRHQWGQKITAGLRNLPIFSLEMTLFASKGSLLVLTRLMNCHTSISAKINCCKYLSRTKQKIIYHICEQNFGWMELFFLMLGKEEQSKLPPWWAGLSRQCVLPIPCLSSDWALFGQTFINVFIVLLSSLSPSKSHPFVITE